MQRLSYLFTIVLVLIPYSIFAQNKDSTVNTTHISGSIGITNNGISIVPSFSLDKPAAIFNLSVGKNKLSFEPDFRFSLAGRPWSFLFWGRYKMVSTNKFQWNVGTHLGMNYKSFLLPLFRDSSTIAVTRRYLAGELYPRFLLTKSISMGIYYLYSQGIDAGTIKNTNYVTLNTNFSHIKLSDQFFMKFNPQFYYLKLDLEDGFYFTSTTTLAKNNFPLTIQSIFNKIIHTNITGSKNFVWNVSLVYAFNNNYVKL